MSGNWLTKQTISSKLALLGLLVLLVFLADLKYRQLQSQAAIEQQRKSLQQQADALEQKNSQLAQSLQYLNSSDFKERVAREDLGLKKQGEQVYAFTDAAAAPQAPPDNTGNAQKWWDYFFGN